jgi:hypothetical protein
MNLFKESTIFSQWFVRVMGTFFRIRPYTTFAVIIASSIGSIARILSFLLPLKVILLAGSDGVPRYFQFFVHPEEKMGWIIGLSILAVISYFLALILEALVNRLSRDAGNEIMMGANHMTFLKNQEEAAQGYYTDFCDICASLLFLAVSALVFILLNPWLFFFLSGLIFSQFILSSWALRGHHINPGPFKAFVQDRLKNYLKILSSVNFLAAFLFILAPFLIGAGGNILVGIISIVLIRRSFGFMSSSVYKSVGLAQDKDKVDALIFPDIQLQEVQSKDGLALRDLFHKQARQSLVEKELNRAFVLSGTVDVHWKDSPVKKVSMFTIRTNSNEQSYDKYYQLQVFSPKLIQLLEDEDFLFRYFARDHLKAPRLVTRFKQPPFECQICEYGFGKTVSPQDWKTLNQSLLKHYWSCQPPEELINAYKTSRTLLSQRLNDELVSRLIVAVDNEEEAEMLRDFQVSLKGTRERLNRIPLYVHNPDISPDNVIQDNEGQVFVMTWGDWSLEPVGAKLSLNIEEKRIEELIENMRKFRSDVPDDFGPEMPAFAALCGQLEKEINQSSYKAAFRTMQGLLKFSCN